MNYSTSQIFLVEPASPPTHPQMDNMMKILIIGNGGREHALAWKVAQSPQVTQVFVAPGNAGTALEAKTRNVSINPTAVADLLKFAQTEKIDLTIVGPEAALAAGVADQFALAGLPCFGPQQKAAQLETSKVFCKQFLHDHNIATARYQTFHELEAALHYAKTHPYPLVIKADGLAAGKGVIIAQNFNEASDAIKDMLSGNAFGQAGRKIVIEEFLQGEEASFIIMVAGEQVLPLASSQDHKARDNGDQGPNTGGMGAYSPAPVITPTIHDRIMQTVIKPTLRGLTTQGITYYGFLYAGLMISPQGEPKVLEFNCRLGDPETQPLMLRLKSDLVSLCQAALNNTLESQTIIWDPRPALGVVLASQGYPEKYPTHEIITGLEHAIEADSKIFHAGTQLDDGKILTAGGRVLCATALGGDIAEAQERAYHLASQIRWEHIYYRTDIGYRAIKRSA